MFVKENEVSNMTLKEFLLKHGREEFRCPRCKGYMFGSSAIKGSDDREYYCTGNEEWSCTFEAPSWEEFQKHFVFSVKAILPLDEAQELLGADTVIDF